MKRKISLVAVALAMGWAVFSWARPFGPCTDHTPPQPAVSAAPPQAQTSAPPAVQLPGNLAQMARPAVSPLPPSRARPWKRRPQPRINPSDPFGNGSTAAGIGYPGDETSTPEAVQVPAPENPVVKLYEGGRFAVRVSTERHYAYRIGHKVKVSIMVLSAPDVKFNFSDLKKHILVAGGADFELVESKVSDPVATQQGLNMQSIELTVQSMLDPATNTGIIFLMDLRYAVDLLPDGKTPNWKVAKTPDFIISTSRTADNGTDMLEGDLDLLSERTSWLAWPLLFLGVALLSWYPWVLALRWQRSRVSPQALSANELAWRSFNEALAAGNRFGFTVNHYRQIAASLRQYFGVEAMTITELRAALQNLPPAPTPEDQQRQRQQSDLLESALTKLDAVLTSGQVLSDAQRQELVAQLEQLVRKP